ncbi:MAG: multiubiquitin domain-containing protein [Thermoanaerobaculia bacterium]
MSTREATPDPHPQPGHGIPITIDRKPYKAPKSPMTGAELRALADPPIGPDRDLYLEVPGRGQDPIIQDNQSVDLKEGMHFYSAPKTINPGE